MIANFSGEYRFLSNFYVCDVMHNGILYPSTEHAYVASKTTDKKLKILISEKPTPGIVKRFGRTIDVRSDWDLVKLSIMRSIVEAKFTQNKDLMDMLIATKPHELVEGNTWGDTFWGQSPIGKGRNELGKILMSVRDDVTRLL